MVSKFSELRAKLSDTFNTSELRGFCFDNRLDLDIEFENLEGNNKDEKIISLIEYCFRHGKLDLLIEKLSKARPHENWNAVKQPIVRYQKNRITLLQHVKTTCDEYLKETLHQIVALEFKLNYQMDAISRTWLSPDTQEIDKPLWEVFEIHGRSLLILGEPGSGKTTTLLQLAQELIEQANRDPDHLIPVYLNLSSWGFTREPFADWLAEEIFKQYQVARSLTYSWIKNNQLLFLLDGLDEVVSVARDDCIKAINEFKSYYPASMAICSRLKDYKELDSRLNLGAAVYIKPLSKEQIDRYLEKLDLYGLQANLKIDTYLAELARSPLMLNIMILTYGGLSRDYHKTSASLEGCRSDLLDKYIQRMFERRPLPKNSPYNQDQAITWLANLAHGMTYHKQSEFYIEYLQPTWLMLSETSYRQYAMIVGIITGAIIGLLGIQYYLIPPLIGGLVGGWIGWSKGGQAFINREIRNFLPIELVEEVRIDRLSSPKQKSVNIASVGLVGAGIFSAFNQIVNQNQSNKSQINSEQKSGSEESFANIKKMVFPLVGAIGLGLMVVLSTWIQTGEVQERLSPNQGIRRTIRNALKIGLIAGLGLGLFCGLIWGLITEGNGASGALLLGLLCGFALGAWQFGGIALIRHYALRYVLAESNILPFPFRDGDLVAFLDDMSDHGLLRRTRGGWIFIHRMLQEHFDSLHPDNLESRIRL